jgi:hypothetical protein
MITHIRHRALPYRISYSHLWPEIGSDLSAPNFTLKQDTGFRYCILTITVLRITYSLSLSYLVTALALALRSCNDPVLHVWLPPTATWCSWVLSHKCSYGVSITSILIRG